jgi:hypothetical protein
VAHWLSAKRPATIRVFGGEILPKKPSITLPEALLAAFDTNDRINHYLIENLPSTHGEPNCPPARAETLLPSLLTCIT